MKQAEEARRAAVAAMPELKALADKNAELTQEQNGPDGFPAKIAALAKEVDDVKKELVELETKFKRVQERIDAAGMTDAVGLIFAKAAGRIARPPAHRQRLAYWRDEASRVHAKLIELDDQYDDLDDLDAQVNKVMGTLDPHLAVYQRYEIEAALRELLKARRGYLKSQCDTGTAYLEGCLSWTSIAPSKVWSRKSSATRISSESASCGCGARRYSVPWTCAVRWMV